ncbi:sensor histidine kinase [Photobacterium profundum]|uniref:sensor histidine kinase n=1 Tax=Photobacterium profundum TaxID=74109 RepID=UPI003D110A51
MDEKKETNYSWGKSFLLTSIFCFIIALTTQAVWSNSLLKHLIISFGFGYSAIFSAKLIHLVFPSISRQREIICTLSFSMVFGTLNAQYWVNDFLGGNGWNNLKPVILLGLIFTGFCYYFFYSKEQKLIADKELETLKRKQTEQEKVLLVSQLKQLQSQIEPHFLFNTLATISVLIETDSNKAKLMLEKLTELLRATLNNTRHQHTTVEQEVSLVEAYLQIQQIRLGERLNYVINIDGIASTQELPPLLIQPLIENALTHGIEPIAKGGKVTLDIVNIGKTMQISVTDNGAGFSPIPHAAGHGLGLENIRQRIEMLFDGKASISIKEHQAGGVISTLILPIEKHD